MLQRLQDVIRAIRDWVAIQIPQLAGTAANSTRAGASHALAGAARARGRLVVLAVVGLGAYLVYSHPPMVTVGRGEVGVRVNRVTGDVRQWHDGAVLVVPLLHDMTLYSVRDRTYQPEGIRRAEGPAPLQSTEGLSFGVDLSVRYALDGGFIGAPLLGAPRRATEVSAAPARDAQVTR